MPLSLVYLCPTCFVVQARDKIIWSPDWLVLGIPASKSKPVLVALTCLCSHACVVALPYFMMRQALIIILLPISSIANLWLDIIAVLPLSHPTQLILSPEAVFKELMLCRCVPQGAAVGLLCVDLVNFIPFFSDLAYFEAMDSLSYTARYVAVGQGVTFLLFPLLGLLACWPIVFTWYKIIAAGSVMMSAGLLTINMVVFAYIFSILTASTQSWWQLEWATSVEQKSKLKKISSAQDIP